MTINGLLPVGSVVMLKNSNHRVMIIGVCQVSEVEKKAYEYVGCLFPEGYLNSETLYLFNGEKIDRIYSMGCQDTEALDFMGKADNVMEKLRARYGE